MNKNIEKLLQKLKTAIEENNSRDLVENYENLLIAIDPLTKPRESWKFAKVKEDSDEKTKAILLIRAIEDEISHEVKVASSEILKKFLTKTSIKVFDAMVHPQSSGRFKDDFEAFMQETVVKEVQQNAEKFGGWKSEKFRKHLTKTYGILTEVGTNGLWFGNHYKDHLLLQVEGFVELPEESAEMKTGFFKKLFK